MSFSTIDRFQSETGAVVDVTGKSILDLYLTKFWALKLACNAAVTILQVDQVEIRST